MVSDDQNEVSQQTDNVRSNIPLFSPNSNLRHPDETAMGAGFMQLRPGEERDWTPAGRIMYISIILNNGRAGRDSAHVLCDTRPNSAMENFVVGKDLKLTTHDGKTSYGQSSSGNPTPGSSAHAAGRRILKSRHGSYLRAHNSDKVDMTSGSAQAWEHWYVEDWKGKVVFKAIHSPGRFIRAHPDGDVELVMSHPKSWETWVPYKNNDGSWSFRSFHGKWLTAHANGFVNSEDNRSSSDHFWLTHW